jgi:hypothetical protein
MRAKAARVRDVLQELRIDHVANSFVGNKAHRYA